ncbi:MAG: glycoside hydrolase family 16 protein, partial [Verrucomicrobia bacterium]|nr:glycoside hydrolase family 16 protein [Verrucomicrobiota bacterium]
MNKGNAILLLIGILSFGMMSCPAESLPASSRPSGERPGFKSKIHIPVQLAKEVASLPPAGYQLVFNDEFDGTSVDTNRWGFRLGDKMLSAQQRENVSLKDGNLVIALRKEAVRGKDYTAGGVISRERFVYGYYEARFKTPPAEGWHTAFWSMRHNFPDQPSRLPALLELDFCEQDGGDPHYFSFGIINQSRYHRIKNRQSWNAGRWVIEDAPDTSANLHVWACEFTPERIRFYFDGKPTKELSSSGFPHDEMNVWFSVIASTLKGDRWVDESKLPNAVLCDYIRV